MYPKLEQRNREYEIFRQNEIPMFPFVNSCVSSKKKNSHYTAKVTLEVANISVKNLLLVTCLPAYQINLEKKKKSMNELNRMWKDFLQSHGDSSYNVTL